MSKTFSSPSTHTSLAPELVQKEATRRQDELTHRHSLSLSHNHNRKGLSQQQQQQQPQIIIIIRMIRVTDRVTRFSAILSSSSSSSSSSLELLSSRKRKYNKIKISVSLFEDSLRISVPFFPLQLSYMMSQTLWSFFVWVVRHNFQF